MLPSPPLSLRFLPAADFDLNNSHGVPTKNSENVKKKKLLNINCPFVICHLLLKSHVSYGSIYFKPPGNIAEL